MCTAASPCVRNSSNVSSSVLHTPKMLYLLLMWPEVVSWLVWCPLNCLSHQQRSFAVTLVHTEYEFVSSSYRISEFVSRIHCETKFTMVPSSTLHVLLLWTCNSEYTDNRLCCKFWLLVSENGGSRSDHHPSVKDPIQTIVWSWYIVNFESSKRSPL